MSKSKKHYQRKTGPNFLDRIKQEREDYQFSAEMTERQYVTDLFMIVLNDPEIMGKDVFGYKRQRRIVEAVFHKYDDYHDALTNSPEADYYRAKLDEAIRRFIPNEAFSPFEVRYDYVKQEDYTRRKKK